MITRLRCMHHTLPLRFFTRCLLGSALALAGWAALPPAAQQAVDEGILRGKQGDHKRAVACFQEARRAAPEAPEVFFYLGVAESKLPGRELRALAWFGAYRSAKPGPSNPAVDRQILALLETQEATTRRLIKLAQDSAQALIASGDTDQYLGSVAELWADLGDFPAALQTAERLRPAYWKSGTLQSIAESQADLRDFAGAWQTADLVSDAYDAYRARTHIIIALAEAGELAEAREKWAGISKAPELADVPNRLRTGETMAAVAETFARIQLKAGDPAAAQETLRKAVNLAGDAANADHRLELFESLGCFLARQGNMDEAGAVLARMPPSAEKIRVLGAFACAKARAGDNAGARQALEYTRQTLGEITDKIGLLFGGKYLEEMEQNLAHGGREEQPPEKPSGMPKPDEWLVPLDGSEPGAFALNLPIFLDLPSYLTARPHENDPEKLAGQRIDVARHVVRARQQINQLLERQSPP
jgi:tetratricopeptide (TPR) repeat protein